MATTYTPAAVNYTDAQLRALVEEYITQQKSAFTFKGLCSNILFWAMEDSRVANSSDEPYESNQLQLSDQDRVKHILAAIVEDGRIVLAAGDETKYVIVKS